jgi:nucleotide-binding universal stress UspA family protein
MSAIRRILVAVKDTQATSHPAVLKAAQIARACNAKVQLFHALATPLYADVSGLADQSLERVEHDLRHNALTRLEVIAEQLRKHSIRVTVTAEWDFPSHEAIIRKALSAKADLIVASRHSGRHTAPWPPSIPRIRTRSHYCLIRRSCARHARSAKRCMAS